MDRMGNKFQLLIQMQMPEGHGRQPQDPRYREPCLEERVQQCMDLIDSGHESRREWDIIRYINNKLVKKYQEGTISSKQKRILEMIQPIIEKYGQMDPRGVEQDASLHSVTRSESEK